MGHMISISASTCTTVLAFNYKSCLEAPLTLRRSCRSCFPIASWCATSSLTQLSPILHVRPCHHLSCHSLHLCCHLQDSCHLQSSVHQMSITTTDLFFFFLGGFTQFSHCRICMPTTCTSAASCSLLIPFSIHPTAVHHNRSRIVNKRQICVTPLSITTLPQPAL